MYTLYALELFAHMVGGRKPAHTSPLYQFLLSNALPVCQNGLAVTEYSLNACLIAATRIETYLMLALAQPMLHLSCESRSYD